MIEAKNTPWLKWDSGLRLLRYCHWKLDPGSFSVRYDVEGGIKNANKFDKGLGR